MKKKSALRPLLILAAILLSAAVLIGVGGYIVLIQYPSIGAQGADSLRGIIGDQAVATLESLLFQAQDTLHRLQYRAGVLPQAPWSASPGATLPASSPTANSLDGMVQTLTAINTQAPQVTQIPATQGATLTPSGSSPAEVQATPVPPTAAVGAAGAPCPAPVPAIGDMQGEGMWNSYLTNSSSGKVAACRTFFQPDPDRPYAIAAVVAFNLDQINLHYVLGSEEPVSDVKIDRPGVIAPEDKKAGVLLAVFNGGFRARHGHFGVMVDGVMVLPPLEGFGTIALYKDGLLRIGAWGTEIKASPDIVYWRQNGPLLVQGGQANPRINNQSPQDWGSSLDGSFPVATWRSAVGLSPDNKTLYYAAGPSLTLQSLAQSLITAGASQAIQLDINNYWAFFGEIRFNGDKSTTIPLFPEWKDNPDRYLYPYIRDFFYVTAKKN